MSTYTTEYQEVAFGNWAILFKYKLNKATYQQEKL